LHEETRIVVRRVLVRELNAHAGAVEELDQRGFIATRHGSAKESCAEFGQNDKGHVRLSGGRTDGGCGPGAWAPLFLCPHSRSFIASPRYADGVAVEVEGDDAAGEGGAAKEGVGEMGVALAGGANDHRNAGEDGCTDPDVHASWGQ
jgi:hypothetical protein